jgi:hypothetical protein
MRRAGVIAAALALAGCALGVQDAPPPVVLLPPLLWTAGADAAESADFAYGPAWSATAPGAESRHAYEPQRTPAQNGAALAARIAALAPGERLVIAAGTYSVDTRFSIELVGSVELPIRIQGERGVVITRADARQNVINVDRARYLSVSGLEITGGDTGLKLYDCENMWIDRCHVHHTGGPAVAANSADTAWLWLTRNTIHHTAGAGEGFYLGANEGEHVMRHSVIARNWVHSTAGKQGDGIEVKQGSYDNRIVENLVHDTRYPCILVYGTGGQAPNVIERNVCFNSGDNVLQVQGEALVRNNLLMNGLRGFASHDHQGQTRDLVFVHNTIVNPGRGAHLLSWSGRPGMVFANNAVYSQSGDAVRFHDGAAGVQFGHNVVLGSVAGAESGWSAGRGLSDFIGVAWDAQARDARPSAGSALIGAGGAAFGAADDLSGGARQGPLEAGCFDLRP